MKKIKYIATLLLIGAFSMTSCVDTDIDDALDYDDHYKTSEDADNAILGVYSSFMRMAGQMIVLNELRGDLMDLTMNSSIELQEIDAKKPSKDNTYADPTGYYNVIVNCNDALVNFERMYKEKRLNEREFLERYSDLLAMRCYMYLQLAAQFGEVPYITDPIITVADMKQMEHKALGLDELLDSLIVSMTSTTITGKQVSLEPYVESPLIQNNLDGYELSYYFINKYLLLGDLYLWRANDVDKKDYYELAAKQYKKIMDTKSDGEITENYLYMKISGVDTWGSSTANSNFYYQIFFLRYHEDDTKSYNNQWVDIFSDKMIDRRVKYEWAWALTYDAAFAPTYPFVDLFASKANGGSYQLMPSDYAVGDLWGKQKMKNGFTFDGRGSGSSYETKSEGNEIAKYLYHYDPFTPYEKAGRLMLYRAGLVHLRYAEAVNRAGYPKIAYALLNQGLRDTYGTDGGYLILNSPNEEPYYFAASMTETGTKYGYRREPWRFNRGLRGRVSLVSKETSEFADKTLAECTTTADSIKVMEKIILDEAALECAFEGNRFPDLVRVAHRMNKNNEDGNAYMQAVMKGKYDKNGRSMPDYSTEESWFLPFN